MRQNLSAYSVISLTEKELQAEAERLKKILDSGDATISEASRYQSVRHSLQKIQQARRV